MYSVIIEANSPLGGVWMSAQQICFSFLAIAMSARQQDSEVSSLSRSGTI